MTYVVLFLVLLLLIIGWGVIFIGDLLLAQQEQKAREERLRVIWRRDS
jgi:hypothetical protein